MTFTADPDFFLLRDAAFPGTASKNSTEIAPPPFNEFAAYFPHRD